MLLARFLSPSVLAANEEASKTANMSVIYGIVAAIALVLVGACCLSMERRDPWFILLFVSVFVVDLGYFALSVSGTLGEALLANRIAYLGSVFLPLCMLMIIMNACRMKPKPTFTVILAVVSAAIFLLAASGGYLKLYYSEVSIIYINGVARLNKTYGPLHGLYLVYLLLYFGLMIGVIVRAIVTKRIVRPIHAVILAAVVLGNIGVWFVEQLIYIEFEFLSITYIISELFLLLLYRMLQVYDLLHPAAQTASAEPGAAVPDLFVQLRAVWPEVDTLTARETEVLRYILENKKRRDIAEEMCVSENTVKKHTSHIFAKLSITSRSELFARLAADSHKG